MEDARAGLMQSGLNLIQQALSIFDRDLRLAVCNRRYQEMFGLPDALVAPGASFEDTIRYLVLAGEYGPQDDDEEAVRVRVETALGFRPHYMERQRANGRWVSVEGAPLAQGGWVTVYTDITEIKIQERMLRGRSEELSDQLVAHAERLGLANRELAASNAALEEAKRELIGMEARTRLTTEMMPAHIAHMSREMRYTYSNRRLSSVIPGLPSQIVGLSGREVLGEETYARIRPHLTRALAGEPSVVEFTEEDTGRRIRAAFTPDRIGEGPINGVYILSMDVTEEAQARAALTQTRKRELAAQLTSGLAHDFANLLTVILGLQSRLEKLPLPPEAQEAVTATLAAARRGGVLLDRIAQMSGRRTLRPVAVEVADFLRDLSTLASAPLPEGMRLETVCEGPAGPVLLDPGAVQDALVNLILNARDAMAGAGRQGTIRLTARAVRDTWVEFAVDDRGPGFSPMALEHGLDPFFTTKGGEGSGLGLSMVYDAVTLAGGTLRLGNTATGARVSMRLPLRRAGPGLPPRMVLLVEDNPDIRESVRDMLTAQGHAVIEAASADEGLALADLPGIDLVLSDISLPGGLSGVELAETLADRGHPARAVLMTSLPPANPLRARASARFAVLPKPFDAPMLAAALGAAA